MQPYIKDPDFRPDFIMAKSGAAAGLCAWVINICKFYDVYVVVEPKRRALSAANAELQAARDKLEFLTDRIKVGFGSFAFCNGHYKDSREIAQDDAA